MKDRIMVWDLPVRAFHWLLAGSFAGAWLLSESERLRDVHVMLGYTVLGLVAFRLLWGFIGTPYARFGSFLFSPRDALAYLRGLASRRSPRYLGHNPAGSFAIWAILGLALLTVASGYATYNEIGGDAFEELHEFLANAWLLVVGGHIAGVLLSSLRYRENLARSMVTGYKDAEPGATAARPAYAIGGLLVAGVVAFWGWSLSGSGVPPAAAAMAVHHSDTGNLLHAATRSATADEDDDEDDDD